MIAPSLKAKALILAIFVVGAVTGFVASNFYTTRLTAGPNANAPQQRAQRDINKFYDYLGLDQGQREQMHKIGEETRQEFRDLRAETQPRFEAIQEESRSKIRAVLNDEQRAKYDEFRKRMDERRKERERKGPNDRGPGPEHGPRP